MSEQCEALVVWLIAVGFIVFNFALILWVHNACS